MVAGIETFDPQPHVRHTVRRGVVDVPLDRGRRTIRPRLPAHAKPTVRRLIVALSPRGRCHQDESESEREEDPHEVGHMRLRLADTSTPSSPTALPGRDALGVTPVTRRKVVAK